MAKFLAYAFQSNEEREKALKAVIDKYRDLQTNKTEQVLINGYDYVLFIEDCSSLTFNLALGALINQFGGVPREKVLIK